MAAAATPLFVADIQTLKESVRMGAIVDDDAAAPILNDAILHSRTLLIDTLGEGAVQTILATATTASPTTQAESHRVQAELVETYLVKRQLLIHLPWSTMDAAASMPKWHDVEAPMRLTQESERMRVIQEIEDQVNQILARLCTALHSSNDSCGLSSRNRVMDLSRPESERVELGVAQNQMFPKYDRGGEW